MLSLKIRDETDFFHNTFVQRFEVASSGAVSGSFSGNFLGVCAMSLGYDAANSPYQFQGLVACLGLDYGVYFGSGGQRYCQLYCAPGQSLDDCAEVSCLSLP